MNDARVYRHGLVSNTERVRIPEGGSKFVPAPSELRPEDAWPVEASLDESLTAWSASEPALSPEAGPPEAGQPEPEFELLNPRMAFSVIKAETAYPPLSEPKQLTKDELAVIYAKELAELKQAAAENAYFDALKQKKSELRDCVSSVQRTLDELITAQEAFMADYINELKLMAVDIAEKMILEKISDDDLLLQKLVVQSVRNVKNAEWINVELSEQLVRLVDAIKGELDSPEYKGRTSFTPVSGRADTFRVVTEDGTLVGSVGAQAENLRRAFREADKD